MFFQALFYIPINFFKNHLMILYHKKGRQIPTPLYKTTYYFYFSFVNEKLADFCSNSFVNTDNLPPFFCKNALYSLR